MIKKIFVLMAVLSALNVNAIIWQYGEFDSKNLTCAVTGWSGTQPTSGKLTIPSTYAHPDGKTYKVNAVASGALNNLTEVTEITIPAGIAAIGQAYDHVLPAFVENFVNCPKLTKFNVNSSNKVFSTIEGGILIQTEYNVVLKVPQLLAVTSSKLTLPENVVQFHLGKDAMAENNTIETLVLPGNMIVDGNGGLNKALKLKKYEISPAGSNLSTYSGMLMCGGEIISCPPATTSSTLSMPSKATTINAEAFRNTAAVTKVNLGNVKTIKTNAFIGSGLKSIDLPASVTEIEAGTFAGCPNLGKLTLASVSPVLPKNFARDCPVLTTVSSENTIKKINTAAFKNCSSLSSFPLSGATDMWSDSIFYGCGFQKLEYDNEEASDRPAGYSVFAANRNLEKIDASKIVTTENIWSIGADFAGSCMKLKELILPEYTAFWGVTGNTLTPAFGYSCNIEKIVAHSVWNNAGIQFCYSTSSATREYSPKMYIAVSENIEKNSNANSWTLKGMFSAANGATVNPQIFVDAYSPSNKYVSENATYYIPGGAVSNYSEAKNAGCKVLEMFNITFNAADDKLRVYVDGTSRPEGLSIINDFAVKFDNEDPVKIGVKGQAISSVSKNSIKKVAVTYTIDGVPMMTVYPSDCWFFSSIENVKEETEIESYEVYNLQGTKFIYTNDDSINFPDTLDKGVYIIVMIYTDGTSKSVKVKI